MGAETASGAHVRAASDADTKRNGNDWFWCAETPSSAHERVLDEGVVCVEVLFCTQEGGEL